MSGETIRKHREALGLSRTELATHAGVTIGALASIEMGRGSRDKNAEVKIRASLEQLIKPASQQEREKNGNGEDETKEATAAVPRALRPKNLERFEAAHPTWVVSYEFMGLTPESRFTVQGEEGIFMFVRHVTNDRGSEWVDCYGGERNYPVAARAFRPERVNPML